MLCLVVYDIPDDAARTKVADICLDYGLQRIQFSAFMGDISPNYQEELFLKIRRRVGTRVANVQLFPICERDLRQRRVLANTRVAGTRSTGTRSNGDGALGTPQRSARITASPKTLPVPRSTSPAASMPKRTPARARPRLPAGTGRGRPQAAGTRPRDLEYAGREA